MIKKILPAMIFTLVLGGCAAGEPVSQAPAPAPTPTPAPQATTTTGTEPQASGSFLTPSTVTTAGTLPGSTTASTQQVTFSQGATGNGDSAETYAQTTSGATTSFDLMSAPDPSNKEAFEQYLKEKGLISTQQPTGGNPE